MTATERKIYRKHVKELEAFLAEHRELYHSLKEMRHEKNNRMKTDKVRKGDICHFRRFAKARKKIHYKEYYGFEAINEARRDKRFLQKALKNGVKK